MLVLLVAATIILTVEAGKSIHLDMTSLSAHLFCFFPATALAIGKLNFLLLCLEHSSYLRYPRVTSFQRGTQGDQKIGNKIAQIMVKEAQTVAKPKNIKISSSKVKMKVPNIFIKPLLNS
jgi:hypothetical protein